MGMPLSKWRGLTASAVLLTLAAGAPAWADCDLKNVEPGTSVRVSQISGRADVDVVRPRGGSQRVKVEYDDETYAGQLDGAGTGRISFALLAPGNSFSLFLSEAPPIRCSVDVPDFDTFYRVVLIWNDPVLLDLHIVEPGRILGSFGSVSRARPNVDLKDANGQMDIITPPPAGGATSQLSYVVVRPTETTQTRLYSFRLEYATRGTTPMPPYCDENPLADVQAQLIILDRGKVQRRAYGTGRAQCGETLVDARRMMPLRH